MIMPTKEKTLDDLFHETLKDIYFTEKALVKALPRMAKAADCDELREAFENHLKETEDQVDRLEQVFKLIDKPARAKTCEAIKGLTDEAKEVMKDFKGTHALDAGLLSSAQAVEHYEISRYGTLKAWASELGLDKAVRLLDATLQEEKNADRLLTEIAESQVNRRAEAA
jgi:ferritin-like metal-binding protein YciE